MFLETLIAAIRRRGVHSLNNLTAVSNNAGAGTAGLASLVQSGQLAKCILSYLGNNRDLERKYLSGEIAIELCPQGTLAERLRAAGAGIPAFYTPTGVGKPFFFFFVLCCVVLCVRSRRQTPTSRRATFLSDWVGQKTALALSRWKGAGSGRRGCSTGRNTTWRRR